jgi:hypothetical protein
MIKSRNINSGKECELSLSLSWRLLKGFVTYSDSTDGSYFPFCPTYDLSGLSHFSAIDFIIGTHSSKVGGLVINNSAPHR